MRGFLLHVFLYDWLNSLVNDVLVFRFVFLLGLCKFEKGRNRQVDQI